MSLFKKKEADNFNQVPHLPEPPADLNFNFPSREDMPELPSLPPNLPDLKINSIPESPKKNLPPLPDIKPKAPEIPEIKHPQMEKSKFSLFSHPAERETIKSAFAEPQKIPELPYIPPAQYQMPQKPKEIEPIFIRLDKFQTTVQSFEEIKNKVNEIEYLLAKTKEIKEKEEKELEEWEHELQGLKARLNSIDKNMFSKLD